MRVYNAGKPDEEKIKFYGFDMQLDAAGIQLITNCLKKLDRNYFCIHFNNFPNLHVSKEVRGNSFTQSL